MKIPGKGNHTYKVFLQGTNLYLKKSPCFVHWTENMRERRPSARESCRFRWTCFEEEWLMSERMLYGKEWRLENGLEPLLMQCFCAGTAHIYPNLTAGVDQREF